MEVLTIIAVVSLFLYLLHRWNTYHMRKLLKNISKNHFYQLPWISGIFTSLSSRKSKNYEMIEMISKSISRHEKISYGWLFTFCMIDIRDPEYIKIILNSEQCIDRADFYLFPYKTGLLASSGEIWKKHRKMLNPAFSKSKIIKFLPSVNENARILVEVLEPYVDQDAFNIVRLLSALTVDSLMKTSFGLDKDFLRNPYHKFFDLVKKEAASIGRNITRVLNIIFPITFPTEEKFNAFAQEILAEAESKLNDEYDDGLMNFIKILLKNRNNLSEIEIQDEVTTLIISGNASTAITLASVVLMLGIHQDVQEKVIDEIKLVFEDINEEVDTEKLQKLTHLDCVIKESMRLFPIAGIIGRKITSDLKLDDNITLPQGANIFIRPFDVHRNPRLWGVDSNEFKPERFLPENINNIHPYAFIPFSASHRICIGHSYTMNVMKITLCHLLRHFRISADLKFNDIKMEFSFIMRIAQNYFVRIEHRDF